MELYNFFTEVISKNDEDKFQILIDAKAEILECRGFCKLVLFKGLTGDVRYSLIGQIYGDDTTDGDTDLLRIFSGIEYTWFNAYNPGDNNIDENRNNK